MGVGSGGRVAGGGAWGGVGYVYLAFYKVVEGRWVGGTFRGVEAGSNNVAGVWYFSRRNFTTRHFTVPPGPFGSACAITPAGAQAAEFSLQFAADLGFPVP